jgi:hypothetical protein
MQSVDPSQPRLQRLKIAILVVIMAVVSLLVFSLYTVTKFHIVSTNPATNQIATDTPFFKITFNKPLSHQALAVMGTGNVIRSDSISGNTLVLNLNYPLTTKKTYTITITSVQSQSGSQIANKRFMFTAQNTPFTKLPTDQQQAVISNQDQYTPAEKDPILAHLPYSTLDFILTPTFITDQNGQQQLVLQAQILLAPGVSGAQADTDTTQYKNEVLQYIRFLGLNPAKYDIQYQIVNETLTGP